MKTTTPIFGPSTFPLEAALKATKFATDGESREKAAKALTYAPEYWDLAPVAGINPFVAFVQGWHEADRYTSARAFNDNNPSGMGVTQDSDPGAKPATVREGVALHLACLFIAHHGGEARLPDELASEIKSKNAVTFLRDVWRPKYRTTMLRINTVDDFNVIYHQNGDMRTTWAVDPDYEEGMINRAAQIERLAGRGETDMAETFTTELPGVPGGPLITDYPIHVRILPESQKINRPGDKAHTPRRSIQHGNGNGNAFAASDSLWLFNGAKDNQGRPTQTSFHADADHKEVWFNIPGDEITWQAADGKGTGNWNGFSCEMSEHKTYRTNMDLLRRNIYVNADFMGRVAGARLGAVRPERHWDANWVQCCSAPCDTKCGNRHECPNILMTVRIDGVLAWDLYVRQWELSKADELKRMGQDIWATASTVGWEAGETGPQKIGKTETDPGVDATAFLWEITIDRAETTPWNHTGKTKEATGPNRRRGDTFVAKGVYLSNGASWYIDAKDDSRIMRSHCVERLPLPTKTATKANP